MSCLFLCAVKTRRDYSLILYLRHRIFSVNPGIILTMLTFETTLGQVSCPAVIVFVVTRAGYVSQQMGELEILILRKIWRPSLSLWKKSFSCLFYWEYMQPWLGQCYMISAWWIMQGSHSKHGCSVSYDPAVSMAVRETARKLESDFAGRSAWCEDRGSGYNYGRRWTYLQGNIPYPS